MHVLTAGISLKKTISIKQNMHAYQEHHAIYILIIITVLLMSMLRITYNYVAWLFYICDGHAWSLLVYVLLGCLTCNISQ